MKLLQDNLQEQPKRKWGWPCKNPKQLSQVSTVTSFGNLESVNEINQVLKEQIKMQINKKLERKISVWDLEKSLEQMQQEKFIPYLQQILLYARLQDHQLIAPAKFFDSNKKYQPWIQCQQVIFELVDRFSLQQSTGLIAFMLIDRFLQINQDKTVLVKNKHRQQKSEKNPSTADLSGSSNQSLYEMNEKNICLYAKTAFFLASKFNEIHWPTLDSFFSEISLQQYYVMENEILQAIEFKILVPNHFFYLELLTSLLKVSKDTEKKIRDKMTQIIGKQNFLCICPKLLCVFLVQDFFQFEKQKEVILQKICSFMDLPLKEIERMRVIQSLFQWVNNIN